MWNPLKGRVLTEEQLQQLKELGWPEDRLDELRDVPGLSHLAFLLGWSFWVMLLLLCFLPVLLYSLHTWFPGDWFSHRLMDLGVIPRDAVAYNLPVSCVPIFSIVSLLFSLLLVFWFVGLFPHLRRSLQITFLPKGLAKKPLPSREIFQKSLRRMLEQKGASDKRKRETLLDRRHRLELMTALRLNLIVLAIGCAFLTLDLRSTTWVTEEGVSVSGYLEWGRRDYQWSDATKVVTGAHFDEDYDPVLHYQVHFPGGVKRDLASEDYATVKHPSLWILVMVDQRLRKAEVPWEERPGSYVSLHKERMNYSGKVVAFFDQVFRTEEPDVEGVGQPQ